MASQSTTIGRYTPSIVSTAKSNSRQPGNFVIKQQPNEHDEIQDGITFLRSEGVEEQDILPLGMEEPQMESQTQPHDSFSPSFDNSQIEEENNESDSRTNAVEHVPILSSQQPSPIATQDNTCNKQLSSNSVIVPKAQENVKTYNSNPLDQLQSSRNNALNTTYPFDSLRCPNSQNQSSNNSLQELSHGSIQMTIPSERAVNNQKKDSNVKTMPRITIAQLGGLSSKNPSINISSDQADELTSQRSPIPVSQVATNLSSEHCKIHLTPSHSERSQATDNNVYNSRPNEKLALNENRSVLQSDAKQFQQFKTPPQNRISTSTPKSINHGDLITNQSQKVCHSVTLNEVQGRKDCNDKALNVANDTMDQQHNDVPDQINESFEDACSNDHGIQNENNGSFDSNASGSKEQDDENGASNRQSNEPEENDKSIRKSNKEKHVNNSQEKNGKRNNISGGEEIKVALDSVNEGQSFKFSIPGTSRSVTLNFSANTLAKMRNSVTMDGLSRENSETEGHSDEVRISSRLSQDTAMEEVSSSTNIDEFRPTSTESEDVQDASGVGSNENNEDDNITETNDRLDAEDDENIAQNESERIDDSSSLLRTSRRVERGNKKNRMKKGLLKRVSDLTTDKNKGGYQCQLCSKQYPSKRLLEKHVVFHVDQNTACSLCGKLFLKRWMLEQHMAIDHKKEEDTRVAGEIGKSKSNISINELIRV